MDYFLFKVVVPQVRCLREPTPALAMQTFTHRASPPHRSSGAQIGALRHGEHAIQHCRCVPRAPPLAHASNVPLAASLRPRPARSVLASAAHAHPTPLPCRSGVHTIGALTPRERASQPPGVCPARPRSHALRTCPWPPLYAHALTRSALASVADSRPLLLRAASQERRSARLRRANVLGSPPGVCPARPRPHALRTCR
jgi:hypothetical protein